MDQAVIKDVMGYIRLLLNPKDDPAFERVYNKPARRLGTFSLRPSLPYGS